MIKTRKTIEFIGVGMVALFLGVGAAIACYVPPTPTPTIDPCLLSKEVVDSDTQCPTLTPSITETPTVTPEASPSAEPTVTPTAPPSPHGDGLSDGRSSCPECTKAPATIPAGPPATGRAR